MECNSTFTAPPLQRHKSNNRAYARVNGRQVYFGRWGTPQAAERYARFVAELEGSGGIILPAAPQTTVIELVAAFLEHARIHYRKPNGTPTKTLEEIKRSCKVLKDLYSLTPVKDFGPRALKACLVRQPGFEPGAYGLEDLA